MLAVDDVGRPLGELRAATDEAAYAVLWAELGLAGEPPEVDLTSQVVVSATIADDACPPTLTGIERAGDVLTPELVEPAGDCQAPLIARTFVVAIDRAAVTPAFTLRIPAWYPETSGYPEQRLLVEVPEVDPPN